ncbi:hypothetical protein ILUMI_11239, partial [Ignelater luminosus]
TLSGVTLLGLPAEVYLYGMQYSMMTVSLIFVGIASNYIYLPVFYKLQLTTAFDYIELRFDKRVKRIASVFYTVASLLFLPVIIYAPSLAFNQVTGFDLHIIAPIMSLICVFYTAIGGLKAVVWTDTLQFSVTLCTLAFVLVLGTKSVGGLAAVLERSKLGDRLEFFNMNPDPTVRNTFWAVVLGNIALWIAFIGIDPAGVQRFLAVPSLMDARKCLVIFIVFTIITKFISCFSGLIMYTKYFDCDPLTAGFMKKADQILPYYVLEVAAAVPGLSGLFVAGLFSTALSTLSTCLNALSGIVYKDFVAPFMPRDTSDEKASTLMKIITVVLGLISVLLIFVVERLGTILELMLSLRGITTGPILGIFTMGMLFPVANRKGALCGAIGSVLLMSLIIVQNQIYVWNGIIRNTPKPLDTSGCNITTSTQSVLFNYTTTTLPSTNTIPPSCPSEEPFWLYRISFHYYFLLGALVTMIIGLPISLITRSKEDLFVNPDLLSPFVNRFLRRSAETTRCESVEKELQFIGINKNRAGSKDAAMDKLLH